MAEAPLSAQNSESGVVVEFVPSTSLPSVPGGLRTVGLIGKGKISKTLYNNAITRGLSANGFDSLTPKALSLPSTIVDANLVSYVLDLDYTLSLPTSISASSPATSTTALDTLTLNINGDGIKTIVLATSATGLLVAADIQAKVRALTANSPANQAAYDSFTAVYANSLYTLTSGSTPLGTVIVTGGTAAVALKLGVANAGTEEEGGNVNWGPAAAAVYTGSVDISSTIFPFGMNLDGKSFQVYVNGSLSAINVVLSGVALSATDVRDQLNSDGSFSAVAVASVLVAGAANYLRIATLSTSNASLQIGNGTVNADIGYVPGVIVKGPSEPAASVVYTFDYETPKVTADYLPKLFTSLDSIVAEHGEVSSTNTLSLGSQIVFENSNASGGILAVQINPADGSDLAGFQNALNKMATVDGVSIVVPLTVDPMLFPSVKSHVVNSSAPLEKKERTAILGLDSTTSVSTAIALAGSLAAGGNGRRIVLAYPGSVNYLIGNTTYALNGSFLAAAIAGLRINGNYDVAEPMLRKQLSGISSAATNLLRTDKLRLRNGGVTVVELVENLVRITEDTTVDRSTVDSQEYPVTEIVDFVARTVRRLLDSIFIGVKILADTPSIVAATIQVLLNNFEALNIITSSRDVKATLNTLDPRQIDVSFEIQPVRGLRWIKVTFSI